MAEAPHRLFVAVPVPGETREAVRELLAPMRDPSFGRAVRWVHLDTLHLTLRFLGDTPPDRVPSVVEALREAAAGRPAFDVTLTGAGAFPPSGRKIRALWLGISRGAPELAAIADGLTAPLARSGWPPEERPFRPHLTVARTDATAIRDAARVAQALEAAAGPWSTTFRATGVVLFRSFLGGGPPRHEPVEEVALREPG